MTLILSQAYRWLVIQVSDRLVTQGKVPLDRASNKTVVYRARDAVAVLSYTGDAYVGQVPTDQFIADTLSGHRFGKDERVPFMVGGMPAPWLHIGLALQRLEARLNGEFRYPYMFRARPDLFEVLISGWQWNKRGRARPFLAGIRKPRGTMRAAIWRDRRHIGRGCSLVATPDGYLGSQDLQALLARLEAALSPDASEGTLADAIRSVAAQWPTVGRDCMSVLIPPPRVGKLLVRFVPSAVPTLQISGVRTGDVLNEMPGAFSPWVIGPGGTLTPSILAGRFQTDLAGFEVTLDGPPPPHGHIRAAIGGLPRPPAP